MPIKQILKDYRTGKIYLETTIRKIRLTSISAISVMLQSCSPGIAVVNIDNSYAAGCMAATIANRISRFRSMG